MNIPWQAVVLDLDGTVVDTVPLIVESFQHTFRTVLGAERDEDWIRSTIGTPLQHVLSGVDGERANELMTVYLEHNLARVGGCPVLPGVAALVETLTSADVAVGIATAKRRASAEATLARTGLAERLPVLCAFEDTPRHKPAPEPVLHALHALGVAPADAAYVGDAAVDVQAARAAECTAIAVSTGAGSHEALATAGPDYLVRTLTELLDLLTTD